MSGFDRISAPDAASGARGRHDGRRAVFTGAADGPQGVDRWLECTVECARCARSRGVGPTRLLLACVPFALVVPWRDHPLLARCPSCARIAWLRVRYPADGAD
jgi:hypothetical protein